LDIVIVEDNENLREAVVRYLELEGFNVHDFGLIKEAERTLETIRPDLIILDIMLPDGDGFLFAKRIKTRADIPILFLTARSEESDRITGLELGADDYVVKPFSPKELVLRVKAILKRTSVSGPAPEGSRTYHLEDDKLEILEEEHRILHNGYEVVLTAAEWSILTFLSAKAPQVLQRNQILQACLDSIAEGSERTVDTHIKNIRKKLEDRGWIDTIRGFGYRFNGKKL
jgi:DNA-binding response OmpR family regulator